MIRLKVKQKAKKNNFLKYLLFIPIIIIISFLITYLIFLRNKNIINEPIVLKTTKIKTNFNSSEFKYNFRKKFENRKIFKYDYNYLQYKKIDKSISLKENGEKIFELTGILNFTKLDYYYYSNNYLDTSKFNHIHIGMGLDNICIPLTLISIISILKTANKDTYIHFHIIGYNFSFEDMEKFAKLKEINKNIDFIFYSSMQKKSKMKLN